MTHLKTYQAIARNRKKLIDAIFARASNGIVLSLDNDFRGPLATPALLGRLSNDSISLS
jgi:hypothetical protein